MYYLVIGGEITCLLQLDPPRREERGRKELKKRWMMGKRKREDDDTDEKDEREAEKQLNAYRSPFCVWGNFLTVRKIKIKQLIGQNQTNYKTTPGPISHTCSSLYLGIFVHKKLRFWKCGWFIQMKLFKASIQGQNTTVLLLLTGGTDVAAVFKTWCYFSLKKKKRAKI